MTGANFEDGNWLLTISATGTLYFFNKLLLSMTKALLIYETPRCVVVLAYEIR